MTKPRKYTVTFAPGARPGVIAIGGLYRGKSGEFDAAEAVRLVDVKGLAFANPDDEKAARAEVDAAALAAALAAKAAAAKLAPVAAAAIAEPATVTKEQ